MTVRVKLWVMYETPSRRCAFAQHFHALAPVQSQTHEYTCKPFTTTIMCIIIQLQTRALLGHATPKLGMYKLGQRQPFPPPTAYLGVLINAAQIQRFQLGQAHVIRPHRPHVVCLEPSDNLTCTCKKCKVYKK